MNDKIYNITTKIMIVAFVTILVIISIFGAWILLSTLEGCVKNFFGLNYNVGYWNIWEVASLIFK